MNFGEALKLLKEGNRLEREGWNGKNMYIYYVPPGIYASQTEAIKIEYPTSVPYEAYLAMRTVQGYVIPWLASQTDILADDWKLKK